MKLKVDNLIEMSASSQRINLGVIVHGGLDILVTEKVRDRCERPRAMLLQQSSGKMPELVCGHIDADPIAMIHRSCRENGCGCLCSLSTGNRYGLPGVASIGRKRWM